MSNPHDIRWLIESDVFPDYQDEMARTIRETGASVTLLTAAKAGYSFEEAGQPDPRLAGPDNCVIFHGCIGLAERVVEQTDWKPGVFGNFDRLACTSYFPPLGKFLLNDRYCMLPFGELRRMRTELFRTLGQGGQFFMRPNTTRKVFAGMVVRQESFERDLELASFYDVPDHELVVVSPVQALVREWRFVVVDGQVISGSCYREGSENCRTSDCPSGAVQFADQVASSGWEPDRAWTIDVALTASGTFRLIEIGSFSFANLYGCDLRSVVAAIQEVAWDDWARSREMR